MAWNKAYVLAHYPTAFSSRWSNGRVVKTWNVFWGDAFRVRQCLPRRTPTAMQARKAAAEMIEQNKRGKR